MGLDCDAWSEFKIWLTQKGVSQVVTEISTISDVRNTATLCRGGHQESIRFSDN
jgi:hypothetical protein